MRDSSIPSHSPSMHYLNQISELQQSLRNPSSNDSSFASTSYLSNTRSYLSVPPQTPRHPQLSPSFHDGSRRAAVSFNNAIWISPTSLPSPPPLPLPSIPLHKVYTLNCASCDNFLTNRGMRAVLLLKPHIILYSTDAAPFAGPLGKEENEEEENAVERSCLCLTEQMGCYSCGTVIGYTIIQPCIRCTDSIQKHQRTSTHHRYVFYQTEVIAKERLYYLGELGVKVYVPTLSRPGSSTSTFYRSNSSTFLSITPHSPYYELDNEQKDPLNLSPSSSDLTNFGTTDYSLSPTSLSHSPSPAFTPMRPGDVVYWHHLVAGGEKSPSIDPDSRRRLFLGSEERPAR